MKKILLSTALSLAAAISLNAAVYATVNGQEVTDKDIAMLMQSMPQQVNFTTLPPDIQKQIVDQAVERKLLLAQAKKDGVEKDPQYTEALNQVKDEIILEIWMKKAYDEAKVAEAKIKEYYDKNADQFMREARVKASHILVKTEEEAKAIIDELKNLKGDALAKKFSELASTKSLDNNGQNGGDLGWFTSSQMVKPFSDAAFALKSGEVTKKPVQTQFGYHVILNEIGRAHV